MTIHSLKTHPAPFQAVLDGTKRHEIRVNDRGFAAGDVALDEPLRTPPAQRKGGR